MRNISKGSTSHSEYFVLVDSTSGLPKTAVAFGSVTASYARQRSVRVAITPASLAAATTAYSSGGWFEVDATNQPGLYRFDVPDAAFATGSDQVVVSLVVTGAKPEHKEFRLTDVNDQDATAFGLSRLDAAITSRLASASITLAAGAVTVGTNNDKVGYGLAANAVDATQFTQGAADKVWSSASRTLTAFAQGFSDQVWSSASRTLSAFAQGFSDQVWTTAARTLTAFGFSVTVGTNNDKTGYGLSAAAVQAIWDALTSALTTVGSIGRLLVTNLDAAISSRLAPTVGGRTLDVAATGEAGLDFDNIHDATGAHTLTNVTVPVVTTVTNPQGDTSGTTTLLTRLTASRATNLDNLDAAVSTRLATSGYTAPLDAATTKAQVVAALSTDTYAEPSAAPASTASLKDKIAYMCAQAMNKGTLNKNTGAKVLRNNADSGNIATGTDSDDGTTYTYGRWS